MNAMKIGELSRQTGVSIPAIRYYVSLGLLVPARDSYQYYFNEEDRRALLFIVRLKNWGFQLDEIHRILSLKRFAVGVEPEERVDYLKLLFSRYHGLQREIEILQKRMDEIKEEIENEKKQDFQIRQTGLPLRAIPLLCCPHCHSGFQLGNVSMDSRYIFDGSLFCPCGYRAAIKNGILYSEDGRVHEHDKADTGRSLYRECPSGLVSLVQKSYNWMGKRLRKLELTEDKVLMETHLNSFFFFYNNLDLLAAGSLCIVHDKFPEIVELYKGYIDQMGLDLNIVYLTSDSSLPIREGSVDLLLDYNSTNEHGIFSREYYLDKMRRYLKPEANVVGTYFYFEPRSRSLQNLIASYPENHPDNYTLNYFKDALKCGGYRLLEEERIGVTCDSGPGLTFIFHEKEEKLFLNSFVLKKMG